jgi:hypothetical protein
VKLIPSIWCAAIVLTLSACGDSSGRRAGVPPPASSDVASAPSATAAAETTSSPSEPSPAPPDQRPRSEDETEPPASSEKASEGIGDPLSGRKEIASLPAEFYGSWRLTGSGGGFDGHSDPAPKDGEMIVITKANRIETWKSGRLESTVPFRIARGASIFGSDSWLISRGGIDLDVISLSSANALTISENHVECMSWSYERVSGSSAVN